MDSAKQCQFVSKLLRYQITMRVSVKKIATCFIVAGVLVFYISNTLFVSKFFNEKYGSIKGLSSSFKFAMKLYDTINLDDEIQSVRLVINENQTHCINHPKDFNISIENEMWQLEKTSEATFKIFNAYYDDRAALNDQPLVRMVAYSTLPYPAATQSWSAMWKTC